MQYKRVTITEEVRRRAFDSTPSGGLHHPELEAPAYQFQERGGIMFATRVDDGVTWAFSPGSWHGWVDGPPKRGRPSKTG